MGEHNDGIKRAHMMNYARVPTEIKRQDRNSGNPGKSSSDISWEKKYKKPNEKRQR
jgi:hypothetical protein